MQKSKVSQIEFEGLVSGKRRCCQSWKIIWWWWWYQALVVLTKVASLVSCNKLDQVYCAWLSEGLFYIIEKSGDLVKCYRSLTHSLTHRQQNIGLLSFSTVSSLSWVTQYTNINMPFMTPWLKGVVGKNTNANVSGARPSHERVFGKKEAHEVVDRQTQLIAWLSLNWIL